MNEFIKKFGKESRWVAWKLVNKDGKPTKIPFTVDGKMASSADPTTWSSYNDIIKRHSGIGIVFTPDKTLLGIDIDHCLNDKEEIDHAEKADIETFIAQSNTYTEVSPSKKGLHIFLIVTHPVDLTAHKHAPYEVYSSGRYFTFTGRTWKGDKYNIEPRTVTPEEAGELLKIIGYPWKKEEYTPAIVQETVPTYLDDATVLSKMFESRNSGAIRALYAGDTKKYGNDDSNADMALLAHLAFWTGRDATQMERIWVSSPLGAREKTQTRKDYRDRSIAKAINACTKVYSPTPNVKEKLQFLTITKNTATGPQTIIVLNTENICRVLRDDPMFQNTLRYDVFRNTFEILPDGSSSWRLFDAQDAVAIQTKISVIYPAFLKVGKEMVFDAMMKVARENTFDSAVDFITSTKWDGAARLDTWLQYAYGVKDNAYHRAVGSNWIKGLIKRLVEPGCKFDYVLVLEGPQGSRKSTSLAVLGGQWHVETTMSTESKDFFMMFQGKAIIEFSEGETLSRTEVKRMKAIITTQVDKYRPPYERVSLDFPRRCVFAMTTNQEEYLKDETGNRRWLPVRLVHEEANVEWIAENRAQLFAEAYHRVVVMKEPVHDFPKEETLEEQRSRRITDPNTDVVAEWYTKTLTDMRRENGISIADVFYGVFNKDGPQRPMDRINEMSIANILSLGLGLKKKRVMRNGVRTMLYFNESNALPAVDEFDEILKKP